MQGIDLHTHSNISDGHLSPEQLVSAAAAAGIHQLALTDHDSMDGIARAQQAALAHDMQIILGVEISSQWSRPNTKKSYGVHVVALNMQHPEPLLWALEQQKNIRAERAVLICEKLAKILKHDFLPDALALAGGHLDRVTRSHIAQALQARNVVTRLQQAFDRFLKEGKPAYVAFDGLSLQDTIQIIHQAQGFAVLAHPTRYDLSATNIRYLIELFAQLGGDAVELAPENDPPATRQMVNRMIAEHDLSVSIGSDFHGEHMPWLKLGKTPQPKAEQSGIWERFI
ncbi:PHP domain-containing protein [Acinetobacter sp. MD2(2019)]|uniref:PHP domain-containing protein n=1 Tax=Acinetobacter sp. MD2(2019) TaxID=2605273 RepID=UPI002D1E5B4B|nr:PHP domain-containing protein [Acinetobacter sp. MD2(2019)]MEB3754287.1 PHP domain-containing protein [Acinetobacter sp. MD2(2019)]